MPFWTTQWGSGSGEGPGTSVLFGEDARLVVEGDLAVDGVELTEAATGEGWGGIAVNGSLDLEAVTVSRAEVGVDVYSLDVEIANSLITENGVGVRTDFAYVCVGMFCGYQRSQLTMDESCVTESVEDPSVTPGYGIWLRNADAVISSSTIEDNDAYGLLVQSADVDRLYQTLVQGNGAGASGTPHGIRVDDDGSVPLAVVLGSDAGNNRVFDNTGDELSVDFGGYAFLGSTGVQSNRVSQSGSLGGTLLVNNNVSNPTLIARQTYWGTGGAPPSGSVANTDATSPLSTDPSGAAGAASCTGAARSASRGTSGTTILARGGGEEPTGFDVEGAAWLRGEIQNLRASLAENPAADTAALAVRNLYALQRLDRADVLGERTATLALLTGLHGRLLEGGTLAPALRGAAEAALVASIDEALRSGDYNDGRALVATYDDRVTGATTLRQLALSGVWLSEQEGDYAGALTALQGVLNGLGSEEEDLARDLYAIAALYGERLGEEGLARATAPALTASRSGGEVVSGGLALSVRPNPVHGTATVGLTLDAPSAVRLALYDVLGREVAVLAEGAYGAGPLTAALDGTGLPGGVYLLRAVVTAGASAPRAVIARVTLVE